MTAPEPAKSHPLAGLLLAALAVGATFAAIEATFQLAGLPYNVRELFPREHRTASALVFSAMLLWTGFAPMWAGYFLGRHPRQLPFLPAWAAVLGLVNWAMLRFSVTIESAKDILGSMGRNWPDHWALIGRFLALYGLVALPLMATAAAIVPAGPASRRGGLRRYAAALAVVLPCLAFCWVVVIRWASTDNLTELVRSRPTAWSGPAALTGLSLLLAGSVGLVCYGWAQGGLLRKAVATGAGLLAAVPTWALLCLGLDPAVHKYGLTFPAVRFLLGPDRRAALSWEQLFVRWTAVHAGAVFLLATGGAVAWCLLPWRKALAPADAPAPARPADRAAGPVRTACRVATVVWLAFLVYGCLLPFDFRPVPFGQAWQAFRHGEVLFQTGWSHSDMVTNVLMYIPLTFCAAGGWTRRRGPVHRAMVAVSVAAAAVLVSLGLEFLQIFVSRTPSIHDIISQAIGTAIGLGAWLSFGPGLTDWLADAAEQRRPGTRWAKLLAAYAAGVVFYQLLPLNLTISASQIWRKYKVGRITLIPFSDLTGSTWPPMLLTAGVYLPAGCLLAAWAGRDRHPLLAATLGGAALSLACEALQVLVPSRYASTTDVILAALCAAVGGMLVLAIRSLSPKADAAEP